MLVQTFTTNGQLSDEAEGVSFGQFSTGLQSSVAAQVVRVSGNANYSVLVQAGFRTADGIRWGTQLEIVQTMDKVPQYLSFGCGLTYRLRCKTIGTGNTLLEHIRFRRNILH